MQRSGFRQQSIAEIKEKQAIKRAKDKLKKEADKAKLKLNKVKYENVRTLEKRVWELCKQVIRKQNNKTDEGYFQCYTCDKVILDNSEAHTAHWRKKSTLAMRHKYDLRVLKVCCSTCNLYLDGNEAEYTLRLIKQYGVDYVLELADELKEGKNVSWGAVDNRIFLQKLEREYKEILSLE